MGFLGDSEVGSDLAAAVDNDIEDDDGWGWF